MMVHRGKPRGFTLVELLVVLAIIAVLSAILMPVFAQAREKARQAACLSNQKQIGQALLMYLDDYDESVPFARMTMAGPMFSSLTWVDTMRPYLASRQILVCPSDTSELWSATPPRPSSYGINGYFTPNHPPYWGIRLAQVTDPATAVAFAELGPGIASDHFMPMFWGDPARVTNPVIQSRQWDSLRAEPRTVAVRQHQEGSNLVFLDGHAKLLRFGQTWQQAPGSVPAVDWYDPAR